MLDAPQPQQATSKKKNKQQQTTEQAKIYDLRTHASGRERPYAYMHHVRVAPHDVDCPLENFAPHSIRAELSLALFLGLGRLGHRIGHASIRSVVSGGLIRTRVYRELHFDIATGIAALHGI